MESNRVLIDTSIVIDYLRSKNRQKSAFVKLFNSNELCLSTITVFELFNGASSDDKIQAVETICNEIEVMDINIDTSKIASQIYRNLRIRNQIIEFRDILIAATALQYNLSIATFNRKHFERINSLQILDL